MSESLFISDLHLSAKTPGITQRFQSFLSERAPRADALYILGDLFDIWLGDDDETPPIPEILTALRRLNENTTRLFLMHGNRDFLIGERFVEASGCTLLDDPARLDIEGIPTLLMHGDLLCSDDGEYRKARRWLRSEAFATEFLSKSLPARATAAADYRRRSGEATSLLPADILDVNQETVEEYLRRQDVKQLIHGHTHCPEIHLFQLDGQPAQRIVLSDWHEECEGRGAYLRVDDEGRIEQIPFP